jgi:hypothetical protein
MTPTSTPTRSTASTTKPTGTTSPRKPRGRTRRPDPAARRPGYAIGVVVGFVLLYLVNVRPGWEAVPFLTGAFDQVLALVNASIVVGLVANVVYLLRDTPRLKAFGDLVVTAVGLAALVRVWQVFPFDFPAGSVDWALAAHWALAIGIGGSVVALLIAAVALVHPTVGAGK